EDAVGFYIFTPGPPSRKHGRRRHNGALDEFSNRLQKTFLFRNLIATVQQDHGIVVAAPKNRQVGLACKVQQYRLPDLRPDLQEHRGFTYSRPAVQHHRPAVSKTLDQTFYDSGPAEKFSGAENGLMGCKRRNHGEVDYQTEETAVRGAEYQRPAGSSLSDN